MAWTESDMDRRAELLYRSLQPDAAQPWQASSQSRRHLARQLRDFAAQIESQAHDMGRPASSADGM